MVKKNENLSPEVYLYDYKLYVGYNQFCSLLVDRSNIVNMTSVIGTPFARAPRNVRTKNPQILLKNKDLTQGANGIFQNGNNHSFCIFCFQHVNKNVARLVSEVVQFMENFIELAQTNSPDKDLRPAVLTLCANLKNFGAQLEINCKGKLIDLQFQSSFLFWVVYLCFSDQLDRVFIHLRNAGRDDSLDKVSRLHRLEVEILLFK